MNKETEETNLSQRYIRAIGEEARQETHKNTQLQSEKLSK